MLCTLLSLFEFSYYYNWEMFPHNPVKSIWRFYKKFCELILFNWSKDTLIKLLKDIPYHVALILLLFKTLELSSKSFFDSYWFASYLLKYPVEIIQFCENMSQLDNKFHMIMMIAIIGNSLILNMQLLISNEYLLSYNIVPHGVCYAFSIISRCVVSISLSMFIIVYDEFLLTYIAGFLYSRSVIVN